MLKKGAIHTLLILDFTIIFSFSKGQGQELNTVNWDLSKHEFSTIINTNKNYINSDFGCEHYDINSRERRIDYRNILMAPSRALEGIRNVFHSYQEFNLTEFNEDQSLGFVIRQLKRTFDEGDSWKCDGEDGDLLDKIHQVYNIFCNLTKWKVEDAPSILTDSLRQLVGKENSTVVVNSKTTQQENSTTTKVKNGLDSSIIFKCTICSLQFKSKGEMKSHEKLHEKIVDKISTLSEVSTPSIKTTMEQSIKTNGLHNLAIKVINDMNTKEEKIIPKSPSLTPNNYTQHHKETLSYLNQSIFDFNHFYPSSKPPPPQIQNITKIKQADVKISQENQFQNLSDSIPKSEQQQQQHEEFQMDTEVKFVKSEVKEVCTLLKRLKSVRTYFCPQESCDFKTTSGDLIAKHIFMDHFTIPCAYCSSTFFQKDKYKEHLEQVHNSVVKSIEIPNPTIIIQNETMVENSTPIPKTTIIIQNPNPSSTITIQNSTAKPNIIIQNSPANPTTIIQDPTPNSRTTQNPVEPTKTSIKKPKAKTHECSYCRKKFLKNSELTKHIRIHTAEAPFACIICEKRFYQTSSRNAHMKTHEEASENEAGNGNDEQPSANNLNPTSEQQQQQRSQPQPQPAGKGRKKTRKCDVCNKEISAGYFTKHMRMHNNIRPFACNLCDMAFYRPDHLRAHEKSHKVNISFTVPANISSMKNTEVLQWLQNVD